MIETFINESLPIKIAAILLIPYIFLSIIFWWQEYKRHEASSVVVILWGAIGFASVLLCFIHEIFNI